MRAFEFYQMTAPQDPHAAAPPAAADATVVAAPVPGPPVLDAKQRLTLRNYLWIAGAAIVIALGLHYLGPVLTPFLIGAILAYLGKPLVHWAAGKGVSRALSTTLVVALFGLAILALFLVLVPLIQSEISLAARRIPDLADRAMTRFSPWVEEHLGMRLAFDLASMRALVTENMDEARNLSLQLLSGLKTGGLLLVSILVNLALIPVVMFYVLRDWDMIGERMFTLVPRRWLAKTRTIVGDIDRVLAEFLRGQLMVMGVLAIYYAVALSAVGLDRGISIGILTGILVFIPYVGFGLGLVLGVLAALLQWHGWPGFVAVLAVYGVGQLVENYILVPYLVGDRIGLHPLAVIFALLAFGQLFGFAGVLLALPASAALLVGLRHLRGAYVASPVYGDAR